MESACARKKRLEYLRKYKQRSHVKAKRIIEKRLYRQTKKGKDVSNRRKLKLIKILHDDYIKHLITKNTCLSYLDISQGLIEVKRLQVQLIRELKNVEIKTDSSKTTI